MKDTKKIISLLSKYITAPIEDIIYQTSAYSNYVYIVKTKDNMYIYKEYANTHGIVHHDIEVHIQTQIGFPLILINNIDFRIEYYVKHDVPDFYKNLTQIASALSKFHKTEIDCNKTHACLLNEMLDKNKDLKDDPIVKRIYSIVLAVIECSLPTICHNDLQIGNMMNIEGNIKFIDFEYACMGNAMIDIANLFCETMCDYSKDFVLKRERGFTKEQRRMFVQAYFEKVDVEVELREIEKCELYSHFYWFLWSRYFSINKNGPSEDFTYDEYSLSRLYALVEINILNFDEYVYLKHKYRRIL